MKIKVIAIAPYDGWAFIVEEERLLLLRPPYVLSELDEVSKYEVENAISAHGFEECDITFDSIDEVIEFLKDQFVRLRKNQGIEIPSSKELRKLLEYAPDDVLREYLRRAEEELIPKGKVEAAESIVSDLMKLERVRDNPEMKSMAARIIEKCKGDRIQSPGKYMDERFIQEVRVISYEIVEKSFPEEKEYFDFLFGLIMPELQEMEPGEEAEFLREIRGVHPLALGCTAVITVVFQVLAQYTYRNMDSDDIEDILPEDIRQIISETVEGKDQEEFSEVPRILIKNIKKAREKAKKEKTRKYPSE
jgi:hypothetical protein